MSVPKAPAPAYDGDSDTRNRILDTATSLFALKGFKAVALKEIAKAVGIKIPSIYYYYEDKESLIEDVLKRFGTVYREYQDWLNRRSETVASLDEAMDNLFAADFLDRLNPVVRLGMSLTLREQHSHQSASEHAFKYLYAGSIETVQKSFDVLIEKGIIPPSDTKTLATLFMFCVTAGNEVYMHEFAGVETSIDTARIYVSLKRLIKAALSTGVLPPAAD